MKFRKKSKVSEILLIKYATGEQYTHQYDLLTDVKNIKDCCHPKLERRIRKKLAKHGLLGTNLDETEKNIKAYFLHPDKRARKIAETLLAARINHTLLDEGFDLEEMVFEYPCPKLESISKSRYLKYNVKNKEDNEKLIRVYPSTEMWRIVRMGTANYNKDFSIPIYKKDVLTKKPDIEWELRNSDSGELIRTEPVCEDTEFSKVYLTKDKSFLQIKVKEK